MPRININEKWWSDPRRGRLSDKMGRRSADGLMVEAWRLSQEFNGEFFNWKDYFDQAEVEHMSSCGLATLEQGLIYIKGSKECHEWLVERRRSGRIGGTKSAQLRQAQVEQPSTTAQANVKQTQPSSSSSSSSSKKNINTSNSVGAKAASVPSKKWEKADLIKIATDLGLTASQAEHEYGAWYMFSKGKGKPRTAAWFTNWVKTKVENVAEDPSVDPIEKQKNSAWW